VDRGRLESFSDGVFAVAITLLALDITVAGPGHGTSLAHQLVHEWPALAAYVVSFYTIGIVWVNHHAVVRNIAYVDRALLFLNLLLLLFVVLIPFATSTLADYLTHGGPDAHLAGALYGAVNEGMAIGFALIFAWTVGAEDRVIVPVAPKGRREFWARSAMGAVAYLVAIALAFVSAPLALAANGLIAGYYIFERVGARSPGPAATSSEDGGGGFPAANGD